MPSLLPSSRLLQVSRPTLRPLSRLPRPSAPLFPLQYSTSTHRPALNEGDRTSAQDRDDIAQHYDNAKEEQLQEQREGKGKWKEELASSSEQALKADRHETDPSEDHIKKLQDETASSAQAEKAKGG